jgi:hypothetical protein
VTRRAGFIRRGFYNVQTRPVRPKLALGAVGQKDKPLFFGQNLTKNNLSQIYLALLKQKISFCFE